MPARDAFLGDLARLDADEIVMLGDHVDANGMFSAHQIEALVEKEYAYDRDIACAAEFLDSIQAGAPKCLGIHYLEGNHCTHIERWAARQLGKTMGEKFVSDNGPEGMLELKKRGIKYYRRWTCYDGLSIPNAIRLGSCIFTHGITAAKYATAIHVQRFNYNVVHGHTHRAQEYRTRTVRDEALGGWCPGTLSKLQPIYMHTNLTEWTHGYAVQWVDKKTGHFLHVNVPIVSGRSMLGIMKGLG